MFRGITQSDGVWEQEIEKNIFTYQGEKKTGGWTQLHIEEFLHFTEIFRTKKSKIQDWLCMWHTYEWKELYDCDRKTWRKYGFSFKNNIKLFLK